GAGRDARAPGGDRRAGAAPARLPRSRRGRGRTRRDGGAGARAGRSGHPGGPPRRRGPGRSGARAGWPRRARPRRRERGAPAGGLTPPAARIVPATAVAGRTRQEWTELSRSVNRLLLIGRIGRDPEMRYAPDGTAVTRLRLATDRPTRPGVGRET